MRHLLVVIALLTGFAGYAQRTDYGQWYGLTVSTKLNKKWSASVESELRLGYDGLILSAWNHDVGLSYKLNDAVRLLGTYRLGNRYNLENWQWRHRYQLGLRVKQTFGEWDVSWKTRGQWRPISLGDRETGNIDRSLTWRNRISVERKLMKRTYLTGSFEAFHQPTAERLVWTDWRARMRLKRKLDKRLYGSIGAMYQTELSNANPVSDWVVQFSLEWEWKRKKKKKSAPANAATP